MSLIKQIKRYFRCLSSALVNRLDEINKTLELFPLVATPEEGDLYRAMKENKRYNDKDFRELLGEAAEISRTSPFAYEEIVGAMASLERINVSENKNLLVATLLAIEKAQSYAISLKYATEKMVSNEM